MCSQVSSYRYDAHEFTERMINDQTMMACKCRRCGRNVVPETVEEIRVP